MKLMFNRYSSIRAKNRDYLNNLMNKRSSISAFEDVQFRFDYLFNQRRKKKGDINLVSVYIYVIFVFLPTTS